MCLLNLDISVSPEALIDAIAANSDAESYLMAVVERAGSEELAMNLITRLSMWIAAPGEDAEDFREARDRIVSEIDHEFAGRM